jgi:hypothetical protein
MPRFRRPVAEGQQGSVLKMNTDLDRCPVVGRLANQTKVLKRPVSGSHRAAQRPLGQSTSGTGRALWLGPRQWIRIGGLPAVPERRAKSEVALDRFIFSTWVN